MQDLFNDVLQSLESLSNPVRAKWAESYTPSAMRFLGCTSPEVKLVLKEIYPFFKKLPTESKWAFVFQLNESGIFEAHILGLLVLSHDKALLNQITEAELNRLSQNLDNWASVDTYAVQILGYAWNNKLEELNYLEDKARNENLWQCRSAVVATVGLNLTSRGGKGDWIQTLEICKLVVTDHRDMIVKALSWALRELAKKEPQTVRSFIEEHLQVLHPRVKREVMHKLEFGTKN